MGSMDEKLKHSKRIKEKKRARTRSIIAKELIVSGKYKQRIVKDKRGKKHDLDKLSFGELVKEINKE